MTNVVSRISNLLLWVSFCALAGTGFLLNVRLPHGSHRSALGMTRHEWSDWHVWIALVFLALVILHLALHWRWLWKIAARRKAVPMVLGFAAGLGLMLWLVFQPVSSQEPRHSNRSASELRR